MIKKHSIKKVLIFIVIIAVGFVSGVCVSVMATPGTDSDPLISLSYVNDTLIPQLKAYVDEKLSTVSVSGDSTGGALASGYKLVELSKGQTVIADKSTEMILRQGTAVIIATNKGGIADVTMGADLPNGADVPSNHLLIVPFGDGRGMNMATDGILMIKGTYTLK